MTDPNATISRLEQLKLDGMLQAFQDHLAMPQADRYGANELVAHLADMEYLHQTSRRSDMFLKLSKLRYDAVFEQVECSAERNLTRQQCRFRAMLPPPFRFMLTPYSGMLPPWY